MQSRTFHHANLRCGIRFFFNNFIKSPIEVNHIPSMRQEKRLASVISTSEVERIVGAVTDLKQKTILIETRREFASQGGTIAVLHICGQDLMAHPHVYIIVPSRALNTRDKRSRKWAACRNKNGIKVRDYLIPVGPLQILFKNKFLAKLGRVYKEGEVVFPGKAESFYTPAAFYELKENLYAKKLGFVLQGTVCGYNAGISVT
jgi:Putative transposase